ncbi:hypothetical protein BDZ91DRAFT_743876 [Kalaharituber pfeilii]|nr:hypothetical protein BDZ91DRAFT_743876 [Kalaharituber pfeilii]
MKFLSASLLLTLLALPQASFASPVPGSEAVAIPEEIATSYSVATSPVPENKLDKRAFTTCTVTDNGVGYWKCAYSICARLGTYARGTGVEITCFVKGQNVNGNTSWGRMSNGYFIPSFFLDCNNSGTRC